MVIDYDKVIPASIILWALVKKWIAEIDKIITPLITMYEQLALDGLIDKADRKKLLMTAISNLEKDGKIKLSLLQRIILPKLVDIIASKLPDFKVTQSANELLKNTTQKPA